IQSKIVAWIGRLKTGKELGVMFQNAALRMVRVGPKEVAFSQDYIWRRILKNNDVLFDREINWEGGRRTDVQSVQSRIGDGRAVDQRNQEILVAENQSGIGLQKVAVRKRSAGVGGKGNFTSRLQIESVQAQVIGSGREI